MKNGAKAWFWILVFVVLIITSCGQQPNMMSRMEDETFAEFHSAPPNELSTLLAGYGFMPTPRAGAFVGFYTANRYFSGVIQQTAPKQYRIMATVGFYDETSQTIKTLAKKTTCPKIAEALRSKNQVMGRVGNPSILVHHGTTATALIKVQERTQRVPETGFVMEWGCFDGQGHFTKQPWRDVD